MRKTTANTGLAKVAVQCTADTFVVKIASFAKPETVMGKCSRPHKLKDIKTQIDI
jgi:hypothetical protein